MAAWTGHEPGQVSTFPGPIPARIKGQLSLLPDARRLSLTVQQDECEHTDSEDGYCLECAASVGILGELF